MPKDENRTWRAPVPMRQILALAAKQLWNTIRGKY
jgi:hypothetical protein